MRATEFNSETVFDLQEQHVIDELGPGYALKIFEAYDSAAEFSAFISNFGSVVSQEDIGNMFFPVSIRIIPQSEFISVAMFADIATLIAIDPIDNYIFELQSRRQTFPLTSPNMLMNRVIFSTTEEYDNFALMLNVKYSTWRIANKVL